MKDIFCNGKPLLFTSGDILLETFKVFSFVLWFLSNLAGGLLRTLSCVKKVIVCTVKLYEDMIDHCSVMHTTHAVVKLKPEKIQAEQDLNP